MDGLEGDTFRIVLAAYPKVWIGADNCDDCAVKPVITGGQMRKWSVKDGCLILDNIWYCIIEDDKLVVRLNPAERTKWVMEAYDDTEWFRIALAGTNTTWTAQADPKKPVTLTPFGSVRPKYQDLLLEFDE